MAIRITKKSIKEAARSSKINGFTLKEIEKSLEHDAIEALKSSGIKDGIYYEICIYPETLCGIKIYFPNKYEYHYNYGRIIYLLLN